MIYCSHDDQVESLASFFLTNRSVTHGTEKIREWAGFWGGYAGRHGTVLQNHGTLYYATSQNGKMTR